MVVVAASRSTSPILRIRIARLRGISEAVHLQRRYRWICCCITDGGHRIQGLGAHQ